MCGRRIEVGGQYWGGLVVHSASVLGRLKPDGWSSLERSKLNAIGEPAFVDETVKLVFGSVCQQPPIQNLLNLSESGIYNTKNVYSSLHTVAMAFSKAYTQI